MSALLFVCGVNAASDPILQELEQLEKGGAPTEPLCPLTGKQVVATEEKETLKKEALVLEDPETEARAITLMRLAQAGKDMSEEIDLYRGNDTVRLLERARRRAQIELIEQVRNPLKTDEEIDALEAATERLAIEKYKASQSWYTKTWVACAATAAGTLGVVAAILYSWTK